jgi:hypothetical protein
MPRKIAIQNSKIPEYLIVGIPYKIGCKNAGGDVRVVHAIIHSVFENQDVEILICKLENEE